jgi:integrase
MTRRGYGDGGIDARGEDVWRLRYRVDGQRYSVTFKGTRAAARAELRRLLREGDVGQHVPPDRMTVAQWLGHWIGLGCPGRRQERPGRGTVEKYAARLCTHVIPTLGAYPIQKLTGAQIDNLYTALGTRIAPKTCHSVHTVLGAALSAAVRAGALSANPMDRVLMVPAPGDGDHGIALAEDELVRLVKGFCTSPLHLFVAVAAYTGMRRNEVLALRWTDFDEARKTLNVARSLERTKAGGISFKPPKTKRGLRTVAIDDALLRLLSAERDRHLRLVAGIPDGAQVDLSLVPLPEGALIFPSPYGDLLQPRDPHAVSSVFQRRARQLGFRLRLHDLRGSHATQLLRRGTPIDVVARRLGHDPAVMMRAYAKALPSDDKIIRDALARMKRE